MSAVAFSAEAIPPGPLKYQTWFLKVPIHCEGCKRKVKKVLHSIDGVFMTTIDSQEHKVVVVGDVDLDTLIKKLIKSGKQAEVWPESVVLNGTKPEESGQQDQNDNNGDETSEVDEMSGDVKTIISGGGGGDTAGGEQNGGKKKKKKKKKKKNKGNTDDGALAPPAMSMLTPESAAPSPGPTDLISQPYDDFPTYQVIDYFPRDHGTSYTSMYANPISSYMYPPPVNAYAYIPTMHHHVRPPQSNPIRNYEDDYDQDYDDDDDGYNVGCWVM